jgi:hypothetical protein
VITPDSSSCSRVDFASIAPVLTRRAGGCVRNIP